MDSESHQVIPANQQCSQQIHKNIVVTTPGSQNHVTDQHIDSVSNQHTADAQYDTTTPPDVKPMYGGNTTHYIILFQKKKYEVIAPNEKKAICTILKKKIRTKDYILQIYRSNSTIKSVYLVKGHVSNRFIFLFHNKH